MSLARRSITSAAWYGAANTAAVAVLFIRTLVLARLLPVDVFGIYAFAGSIVTVTVIFASFGMGGAFLHRVPETEDEEKAAEVHFTLKLIFVLVWASLLSTGALLFTEGDTRITLLVLTFTTSIIEIAQTPRLILLRRVVHIRLAILRILTASVTTVVAVAFAWKGATLGALLATDFVNLALTITVLFLWRPVWRPRLSWNRQTIRYYLNFGSRNFIGNALLRMTDLFDDLWTGLYLGDVALGYYSRAYRFATYPRTVLAAPITLVAGGTYAELKDNRSALSKAFFRANAFLIRSGFYLGGLLAMVAPEFIVIFLGEKWLPMLQAFRLMLIFTLLDPIKSTVAHLFVAVGRPDQIVRARLVQLVLLIAGLYFLGIRYGIAGVALAADTMLVVGIVMLLYMAKSHVDFSASILFVSPLLALVFGLLATVGTVELVTNHSVWKNLLVKTIMFSVVYWLILLVIEREHFFEYAYRPLISKLRSVK